MDISVIVPIYGVERYIEQALCSLFSQTKTEGVEFILVNDCTKDRSMEIADAIIASNSDLDIKVVNLPVNSGQSAARQVGIDTATGDYTIHFDPDDWCEPNMLEELYNCAKETNADIIGCDYYEHYPEMDEYISQKIDKYTFTDDLLTGKLNGFLWNKLIRRQLYIDQDIKIVKWFDYMEDLLVVVKMSLVTDRIAHVPNAYLHYRQRASSLVKSKADKRGENLGADIKYLVNYFEDKGSLAEYKTGVDKLIYRHSIGLIRRYRSEKQKCIISQYRDVQALFDIPSNINIHNKFITYLVLKGYRNIANILWNMWSLFRTPTTKKQKLFL